jgi:hypothetical protein
VCWLLNSGNTLFILSIEFDYSRSADGNMYAFVTHTGNPIKELCPHDCSYCYMKPIYKDYVIISAMSFGLASLNNPLYQFFSFMFGNKWVTIPNKGKNAVSWNTH